MNATEIDSSPFKGEAGWGMGSGDRKTDRLTVSRHLFPVLQTPSPPRPSS
jgi:hypothetical protein